MSGLESFLSEENGIKMMENLHLAANKIHKTEAFQSDICYNVLWIYICGGVTMNIRCVWEHNGNETLIFESEAKAADFRVTTAIA